MIFNPLMLTTAKKQTDTFGEIFLKNANMGKYLKEKCLSEDYQQLSIKYSVKSFLISKSFSIVS